MLLGVYLITVFSCGLGENTIYVFMKIEKLLELMKETYGLWHEVYGRKERDIDCLPQLPKDNLSMVTLNTQLHKQLLMLVYFKVFTYSMQCVQQLKEEV